MSLQALFQSGQSAFSVLHSPSNQIRRIRAKVSETQGLRGLKGTLTEVINMDGCMNNRAKVEIRWFGVLFMKLGVKPKLSGRYEVKSLSHSRCKCRPLTVFSLRINDFRQKKLICPMNWTIIDGVKWLKFEGRVDGIMDKFEEKRDHSFVSPHIFTTTFPRACLLSIMSYAYSASQHRTPPNSIKTYLQSILQIPTRINRHLHPLRS
jgi:hypothetical protein